MAAGADDAGVITPERMDWRTFRSTFARRFEEGHHVFVVGPNGSGKSILLGEIVGCQPKRNWVIMDAKGGDDPSLDLPGYELIRSWPPGDGFPTVFEDERALTRLRRWLKLEPEPLDEPPPGPRHVRLAPALVRMTDFGPQRKVFARALDDLFTRKGAERYSIVIDEAQIIADPREGMGLGGYIGPILRMKRYHKVSLVLATQYPTWIPKSSHAEARHRFFFRLPDHERAVRAGEIAGDRKLVPPLIKSLRQHEFLYQETGRGATDRYIISRVDQ